jgi:hypothetical protein
MRKDFVFENLLRELFTFQLAVEFLQAISSLQLSPAYAWMCPFLQHIKVKNKEEIVMDH